MSQRSRKTQKSLSQPSTSTNDEFSQMDHDHHSSSQALPNKSLSNQEHAHHVSNVVKYMLAAEQSKIPFLRSTISESVNCRGKAFREVMATAQKVIEDVFGYEVVELNGGKSGKMILYNKLKNDIPHLEYPDETGTRYVLLFLTLAHIYMNDEVCTSDSLIKFLTRLTIIRDGNAMSDTFGNILELIFNDFVKEKYIDMTKNKTDNNEDGETELRWGERAHNELSERSVLEFVGMVYRDEDLVNWPQQNQRMIKKEREKHARQNGIQNGFA